MSFNLHSQRGIDYTGLSELLEAEKWKEADQETGKVMCQAVGGRSRSLLRAEDIDNFPCEDLSIIDQLWLNYSTGRFGFSVQREIYNSLGVNREYFDLVWFHFCERVGWCVQSKWGIWVCVSYSDLIWNLKAPRGHLPVVLPLRRCSDVVFLEHSIANLFYRIQNCNCSFRYPL